MDKYALGRIFRLVEKQANDEGLWFVATTAPEAYLQQELRKLHGLIEHEINAQQGEPSKGDFCGICGQALELHLGPEACRVEIPINPSETGVHVHNCRPSKTWSCNCGLVHIVDPPKPGGEK